MYFPGRGADPKNCLVLQNYFSIINGKKRNLAKRLGEWGLTPYDPRKLESTLCRDTNVQRKYDKNPWIQTRNMRLQSYMLLQLRVTAYCTCAVSRDL